jgi:hypothetical protein
MNSVGHKAQILCSDNTAIVVEVVEAIDDDNYLCIDLAGRWHKPLPYNKKDLIPLDAVFDPPRIYIPHRPLMILGDKYAEVKKLAAHLFSHPLECGKGVVDPNKEVILGDKSAINPLESQKLQEERSHLLSQKIAPDNCWVETGQATKTFRQCWWRSTEPIFDGKKSRYIGRDDSPAAKEARAAIARRNRLRVIEKRLRATQAKSESLI